MFAPVARNDADYKNLKGGNVIPSGKEKGNAENHSRLMQKWKVNNDTAFLCGMLAGIVILVFALTIWNRLGFARTVRFERSIPADRRAFFLVRDESVHERKPAIDLN